jgi:hypothetical protein
MTVKIKKIKRGRMSRVEDKVIERELKKHTSIEDIALKLNRSPHQVADYAQKFYGVGDGLPEKAPEMAEFVRELRTRTEWKYIKEQFKPDELDFYEELYAKIRTQFREDIQPTEELQVFAAIDCTIFINRHKKARKEAEDEILRIEREIEALKAEDPEGNAARIGALGSIRQVHQQNSLNRTKEYTELQKKRDEILEKLKATREQRIKNIESSKQSFIGLIRLLQDKKVREKEGRHMELRRLAMENAAEELRQPHKYMNNEWDQPMLVPEDIRVEYGEQEDGIHDNT